MAEYIDIDAPIDVAVYQRNRRIQVTLRQILDSNDVKYQAADVRPVVRGEWSVLCEYVSISENRRRKTNVKTWMCSNCFVSNGRRKTNFCPNCGADMREGS